MNWKCPIDNIINYEYTNSSCASKDKVAKHLSECADCKNAYKNLRLAREFGEVVFEAPSSISANILSNIDGNKYKKERFSLIISLLYHKKLLKPAVAMAATAVIILGIASFEKEMFPLKEGILNSLASSAGLVKKQNSNVEEPPVKPYQPLEGKNFPVIQKGLKWTYTPLSPSQLEQAASKLSVKIIDYAQFENNTCIAYEEDNQIFVKQLTSDANGNIYDCNVWGATPLSSLSFNSPANNFEFITDSEASGWEDPVVRKRAYFTLFINPKAEELLNKAYKATIDLDGKEFSKLVEHKPVLLVPISPELVNRTTDERGKIRLYDKDDNLLYDSVEENERYEKQMLEQFQKNK